MTKKRAKGLFVVFSIILALLLLASFVSFTYPLSVSGNYYSYSNFVSNLRLGQDVGGSVRILYRANQRDGEDTTNYADLKESTINQLTTILNGYGYYDLTATTYGNDGILLNVGNVISKQDEENIISLIGSPVDISFGMSSTATDAVIFASDVASVEMQEVSNNGTTIYQMIITFKDAEDVYNKITSSTDDSSGSTLYGFLGDTTIISLDLTSDLETIRETGQISFYSESIQDRTTANRYVNMIRTGILDLQLTQIECTTITPTYGSWATLSVAIVSAIVVLAMFIYLIVKYRQIGWIACFNLLFFITISLFIMQSIPIFNLNFSGILAMLICFVLVADMLTTIIEKAKQHYNQETQLYISFNMAKKETWMRILITLSVIFVVGLIGVFMPSMAVKSVGWVMLVMSVVALFTTLVLMRLFINMYLPLNPKDGKKCNFHKGGKNA